MRLDTFCTEVYKYLGLDKPYDIKLKSREHEWAAGFCEQRWRGDRIVRHVITIYLPNIESSEFDLYAVIAHEFIHAWQAEHNMLDDPKQWHGAVFQQMAADITFHFSEFWDIKLLEVYSPASDIDD